ncbi:PH domain-containing protein [uncultured Bacteroides sp.]|uniref:PH domain-containing protein n=1 Tax=uncultured Bacteroides sp. TaxID=162156 RepID=UPI002AAAA961|nr:PH domain-containing protein [uncultured Bacteroides sp.]
MNRIYHARIVWYHYLYIILLLAMLVVIFMGRNFIFGGLYILFLVYMIDKIIYTVYTVTPDHTLIISKGRFSRKKVIPIDEIALIDEMFMLKIAGIAVTKFILIKHDNRYYSLLPDRQTELLELLKE